MQEHRFRRARDPDRRSPGVRAVAPKVLPSFGEGLDGGSLIGPGEPEVAVGSGVSDCSARGRTGRRIPCAADPGARPVCYGSPPVLERAALHQTRFRTPGVTPDTRGVVLGGKGLVLFPSIDRVVAFLRAYGDEGSLDELLPSIEIRRVITRLRTQEFALSFQAESSYRMDRVSGMAKLSGGLLFTGTSRHFVQYRDAASPLGYDVQQLLSDAADLILYHDSFQQAYSLDREVPFRDLVLKLAPHRAPPGERTVTPQLQATAEIGIGAALVGYLFRWQVQARAALAEWPSRSAFEDAPRRLYVFEMQDAPARIVELMEQLPGVHVFEPLGPTVGVQLGYRHPISLRSCASLFDAGTLHLFRGDGQVEIINPLPPFAPVRSLVRTNVSIDTSTGSAPGKGTDADLTLSVPLRLSPTIAPWRAVVASIIPAAQRAWLARILYALPPSTLAALRIAMGDDRYYLLNARGIEGIPLGTFYCEVAPRIYVPAGLTLVPAVTPAVLEDLVRDRGDGHVFFEQGRPSPRAVPDSGFGPVSHRILSAVNATAVAAEPLTASEPSLPLLQYDESRRFPLWGVPGKKQPPSAGDGS